MEIDLPTLMVAGSFVAAVSGMFLIFAWFQNRQAVATLWWAASNLLLAVSVPMMARMLPTASSPTTIVAITLLNMNPALIWASARACNNRRVNFVVMVSGACLWLLAATTILRGQTQTLLALNMAVVAAFLLAAAYEFWRDRHERINARWPLIVLLGLHGGLSLLGAVEAATGRLSGAGPAAMLIWLQFVHFETLAFIIGTSIFTVAMAREKSEMQQRIAASTDALTGLATRRAFYEVAESIVTSSRNNRVPLGVIVFDLDAFKSINDTFGHSRGDDVLRAFGRVASKTLRSTDLIGRLGGEEFAAILPGASNATAFVAAERIRAGFSDACRSISANPVNATVSAGIAQVREDSTLDSMLTAADHALYEAKRHGRNRVEVSDAAPISGMRRFGALAAQHVA
jgi:diguanylate cyclase (GGDEF)-like protein